MVMYVSHPSNQDLEVKASLVYVASPSETLSQLKIK